MMTRPREYRTPIHRGAVIDGQAVESYYDARTGEHRRSFITRHNEDGFVNEDTELRAPLGKATLHGDDIRDYQPIYDDWGIQSWDDPPAHANPQYVWTILSVPDPADGCHDVGEWKYMAGIHPEAEHAYNYIVTCLPWDEDGQIELDHNPIKVGS